MRSNTIEVVLKDTSAFLHSTESRRRQDLPHIGKYRTPVDDETIGHRIRQLRKKRGLSQAEVAETLGVHQSRVSECELGTVRIPATVLAAFGQMLKTPLDEIVGLKPIKDGDIFKDRRFVRRLQRIEKLPKRAKQALLKTIDTYLDGAEKR